MVEHLKKEYKKRTIETEQNLSIKDTFNRLYNVKIDPIEDCAKSITQEYEEKIEKLGKKRENEIKELSKISDEIIEYSKFFLDEIGPILADLISLYLGKEYKYIIHIDGPKCYNLIAPLGIRLTKVIPENVYILNKQIYSVGTYTYFLNPCYEANGDLRENQIFYHDILEQLPFLQEYIDILIEHKINELPIEKRKISMINYEYIFIKVHQKEIEEIHKNLKIKEEQEMQEKIAINSSNREKMLAKLLEEANSEN